MFIKNGSFKKYTNIISYIPVRIYEQPISAFKATGSNYTFTINIRGSEPLTYQWYKNNLPLLNKTTKTLFLSNISLSDSGNYYCKVGNNTYTINSDVAILSVINPPIILNTLQSLTANINNNISLSISASDTYPLTYNWYKNNNTLNATNSSFYIYSATSQDSGNYFVTVSNIVTTVTSNVATLSVF